MGANRRAWDADVAELAEACNGSVSTVRRLMAELNHAALLSSEPLRGSPGWYRFHGCRENLPDFVRGAELGDSHSQFENDSRANHPASYEHQQKTNVNTNGGAADIPSERNSDEFREAWSRWLTYRRQVGRKPVSKNGKLTKLWHDLNAEFNRVNSDKQALSAAAFEQMCGLIESLNRHALARAWLGANGPSEVSLVWDCPINRTRLKSQVDKLPEGADVIVDLKTTAKPIAEFGREISRLSYHMQGAVYCDALQVLTGESQSSPANQIRPTRFRPPSSMTMR